MIAWTLLVLGILSRFIIHAPNFTPVVAIALFSGFYMNKKYALILPLGLMAFSDLFLGGHPVMFFTWGALFLIAFMGLSARPNKSVKMVAGQSLLSAVLFFTITNIGVWLMSGMYPLTWAGLGECFTLAIPFFRNTVFSTVLFTGVLFGVYEFALLKFKNTRFAHVL